MSEPKAAKTPAQPETLTISVARYVAGESTFFSVKRGGETLYRFPNEREANQFKRSLERAQCSPPKSERTYTAEEVAKLLAASERTARDHADKLAAELRETLDALYNETTRRHAKSDSCWITSVKQNARAALADYDASKGGKDAR